MTRIALTVAAIPAGKRVTWITADIEDEALLTRAFAGCASVIQSLA
jgi:hypothetical protein